MKAKKDLVVQVMRAAEERAREALRFCGDAPWQGVPAGKRYELEAALVEYSRRGATEAVDYLVRHGELSV